MTEQRNKTPDERLAALQRLVTTAEDERALLKLEARALLRAVDANLARLRSMGTDNMSPPWPAVVELLKRVAE